MSPPARHGQPIDERFQELANDMLNVALGLSDIPVPEMARGGQNAHDHNACDRGPAPPRQETWVIGTAEHVHVGDLVTDH